VATITTAGFRDILEIAYERRYSQYDINLEKTDLLVPRERTFTITERMSADGELLIELCEASVGNLVKAIRECGAQAVAICLLHAKAWPVRGACMQ
jgi:N-methylhydantoinase A